jgi:predicted DNA-binding antitoxin AbrB/MazE fold protein
MRTIRAVFENGVFKPQTSVDLAPGAQVDVLVPDKDVVVSDDNAPPTSEEMKRLYPHSWGILPADEADRIRGAIEEAHQEIDPNAWR